MKTWIVAAATLCASTGANAAPLNFNGITAGSSLANVQRLLPDAIARHDLCRPDQKVQTFADGPTLCYYLESPAYQLGGYDFDLTVFFYPSGDIKTVALRWPDVVNPKKPSKEQVANAYLAVQDLYVSKYGRPVRGGWWEVLRGLHSEWQADGTASWHDGGERIVLEAQTDTRIDPSVHIEYHFADRASFHRF